MAVKTYKPTSSGRRFVTVSSYDELTGDKPEKSLLHDQRHSGGRNNQGKITCRHIGGGNRTKYRIIDFKRAKDGIPRRSRVFSMTRTGARTSHFSYMRTALRRIFWLPSA